MGNKRVISQVSYQFVSLIIAAISGAIAVLLLQLYKRAIVRQTLRDMREFQGQT